MRHLFRVAALLLLASLSTMLIISLVGNCSEAAYPDRFPPSDDIRCHEQEREIVDSVGVTHRVSVEDILIEALGTEGGTGYTFSVYPRSTRVIAWIGEDCSIIRTEETWLPHGIPERAQKWK